jgi:tetratricopeptide (TPR) repeat protein
MMLKRTTRTISILTTGLLVALVIGLLVAHRARNVSLDAARGRAPDVRSSSLADRQIAMAEAKIERMPQYADAYAELSAAFMHKARESGDSSYYARAEAACKKGLELDRDNYAALRQLAWVYNGQHRFQESLTVAQKAQAREPQDPWNYGTMGDALVELGNYQAAVAAYQKMNDLRPDTASYSRAAYGRELFGDSQGAIRIMGMALNAASARDPEMIAWCRTQLGHLYFGIGQLQAAEQQYTWALQTFPHYYQALLGMGRVRAAQKKLDEAIDYYSRSIAVAPQPEAVAELGDLYALLGRRKEAMRQYELIDWIEQINRSRQIRPDAWLALFYADHDKRLAEAVAIAERQAATRSDIRTCDALAWAYYKAGRYTEADKSMMMALRLGTKNAGYFYHAGMIKYKLGQMAAARDYLRRALDLNPGFHPLHAEEARRRLETPAAVEKMSQSERGN